MIIASLPMMVCGLLSVLLALSAFEQRDKPKFRLMLFMLAATLLYMGHFMFFCKQLSSIPLTDTIYSAANLAVFPLYYMYIQELTQQKPDRLLQCLYMLPSLAALLVIGTLYAMMDSEDIATFIQQHLYNNVFASLTGLAWWQAVVHVTVKIVFALEIPAVLICGYRLIRRFNHVVDTNFSNTEGKRITRLNTLLAILAVVSVISFVSNIVGRYHFADSVCLLAIPSLTFSVLLLLIGHVGINQNFSVHDMDQETLSQPVAAQVVRSHGDLPERICRVVQEEKLFLQPNLKINDLAVRLNTNRNYIYNAINVEMGVSFSDFINKQRIDYAAQLMKQNQDLPIADVTIRSGFTSTSAFYRNFKLYKGCSPRDYRK